MYSSNSCQRCFPLHLWSYQWYETLLHTIRHVANKPPSFPCRRYHQWPYPFLWGGGDNMDYGPDLVVHTYKPGQRYLLLSCVAIPMIWNTVACSTSCNEHTADISMLPLPPVIISVFGGCVAWIMVPTPLCMHTSHFRGVCPCPVCSHSKNLKHCCMQYIM